MMVDAPKQTCRLPPSNLVSPSVAGAGAGARREWSPALGGDEEKTSAPRARAVWGPLDRNTER